MGDTPHKQLPKLRTFQLDQAHARGEEPVPVQKEVIEKNTKTSVSPLPKIIVTTSKKAPSTEEAKPTMIHTPAEPPVPPAFHELKKNPHKKIEHFVAEATNSPAKTVTVREKAQAPLPRSFSSEATVITSAKKNEFKFFPSILTALKEWVGGFKNTNSSPKYTVSTTERRKGLIQKATTKSGAIFTTDNISIKDEITKKRAVEPEESVHPTHLNWTPNTEVGYSLLEEKERRIALPAQKSVVVEYKKKTLPKPEIVEPIIKAQEPPKRVFVPPPTPTIPASTGWESDKGLAPDSPYAPTAHVTPTPRPAAPVFRVPENIQREHPVAAPMPPPQTIYVPPMVPVTTVPQRLTKPGTSIPNKPNPRTSYLRRGLKELFRFDTTVATVVVVGSLVSFVMVFLIVKTFFGMIAPTSEVSKVPTSLTTPLTPSGEVVDVAISALSVDALESALKTQARPAAGVVEFRILEANGTPLTGSQLWGMFGFSSNPNLSRSINAAHLGYANAEHMLVLQVTDAVTVFGALLLWETNMAEEFTPLFDEEVRPVTSVEDVTIKNSDVRILKNNDDTILVYGFIDKNIVVITESIEAYEATLDNI
jgi:hypothetical protein